MKLKSFKISWKALTESKVLIWDPKPLCCPNADSLSPKKNPKKLKSWKKPLTCLYTWESGTYWTKPVRTAASGTTCPSSTATSDSSWKNSWKRTENPRTRRLFPSTSGTDSSAMCSLRRRWKQRRPTWSWSSSSPSSQNPRSQMSPTWRRKRRQMCSRRPSPSSATSRNAKHVEFNLNQIDWMSISYSCSKACTFWLKFESFLLVSMLDL